MEHPESRICLDLKKEFLQFGFSNLRFIFGVERSSFNSKDHHFLGSNTVRCLNGLKEFLQFRFFN